jgi:hypothetical protein
MEKKRPRKTKERSSNEHTGKLLDQTWEINKRGGYRTTGKSFENSNFRTQTLTDALSNPNLLRLHYYVIIITAITNSSNISFEADRHR